MHTYIYVYTCIRRHIYQARRPHFPPEERRAPGVRAADSFLLCSPSCCLCPRSVSLVHPPPLVISLRHLAVPLSLPLSCSSIPFWLDLHRISVHFNAFVNELMLLPPPPQL